MYKTVKFNIFRENLQDIVFEKNSVFHPKNNNSVKDDFGDSNRKSTEIILKPITAQNFDRKIMGK